MTTLDDLFTTRDAKGDAPSAPAADDRALGALLAGTRRATPASAQSVEDDTRALIALVGSRARAASMVAGAAPAPTRIRRAGGTRDWLTIVLAALAVVAVVVAAVVVGVVAASASPASDAVRTLSTTEAALVDELALLDRDIAALESTRQTGLATAEAVGATVASLYGATDEPARVAADGARQAYVDAVSAIELPASQPAYRRGDVDPESLASVGTAIDAVNTRLTEVAPEREAAAAAKAALQAADDQLGVALATFTATVPAVLKGVLAEAPDADADLRKAVTDASAALSSADLRTPQGAEAARAYMAAVSAMGDDQERAERAERAAAEEAERESSRGGRSTSPGTGGGGTGGSTPAPGDGSTTPVDPPADPSPPVTEPDPGAIIGG